MSTLRDDLLPVFDDLRQLPDQFGLRRYSVVLRTRTWSGGEPGIGSPVDTDTTVTPPPRVRVMSPKEIAASGGTYQDGDFMIEKITPRYTSPTTGGWSPGLLHERPGASADDVVIVLTGDEGTIECTAVKFFFDRAFNYRIVARARRVVSG